MFHLLINSGGWGDRAGSLSTSRVYIRPDNIIQQRFLREGGRRLNIDQIRSIPALLMAETGSDDSQLAHVANITNISQDDQTTNIQYTIDRDIPAISNTALETYHSQFGSGNFGFNHTCWKIIEDDLYKIILTNMQTEWLRPTVFHVNRVRQSDPTSLSVMMPFSSDFNDVYIAIQNAAQATNMRCDRADNIWEENAIIQDIVNLIVNAKVVVCDCTDKNPNVFYEIGIAHTLGKEVILITQHPADVPFDLRHLRFIRYHNNEQGRERLTSDIAARLNTINNR